MSGPASMFKILDEAAWTARRNAHTARLKPIVEAHLHRQSTGEKHPVMDFLFTYYPFAPARLMRWNPGWGVQLAGCIPEELVAMKESESVSDGWRLRLDHLHVRRLPALDWMISLLEATAERPPRFGCYGLHEWAMVYRSANLRHARLPLRFSREETAAIVESLPIACSHFDAFRFFTPEARPLNRLQPVRTSQVELDQPGCLHVNMDLYKWSMQFHPWVASELVADCFELAVAIREVDMRASPYDLSRYGLDPIAIETAAGREEYVRYQKEFADRAMPVRMQLLDAFRVIRSARRELLAEVIRL